MQKITPFLWFDTQAEQAANFYTSIFKNSKILSTTKYGDAGPGPKGSVMSVIFQLEGQSFYALNGGPKFKFTPAISLFVDCKTQAEVDELWEKLSAGGAQPLRLADRPIRSLLANHSLRAGRASPKQRPRYFSEGHESDDADG